MLCIQLLPLFLTIACGLRVLVEATVTQTLTTFITVTASAPDAAVTTINPAFANTTRDRDSDSPKIATSSFSLPSISSPPPASGGVNPSLIPPFGVTAGIKLNDGTPRCAGLNGKPIGCDCPPDANTFLTALQSVVASGGQFPSGSSASAQLKRLNTCIITLQNFRGGPGSGVGCPAVSTNWGVLQKQLTSEVNR